MTTTTTIESPGVLAKPMKPTESNGTASKTPLYPVEGSSNMISETSPPDSHTADIVTAVQHGFIDRVIELIENDLTVVTAPANDNITLLHWAAINNRIEIARYLIDHGAKIDAIGGSLNSTPLHWAVRDGKLEMIVFLLAYGSQIDLIDGEGFSPLHLASMFGHTAIAAYLIAKGQDVDQPDTAGVTPLMHAVYRVRSRDPTQLLIRLGARINYQNENNQQTALHYAILGNNSEAIRVLIDAGAKTDIHNADKEDPIEMATKSNTTRHLAFLITSLTYSNSDFPIWMRFNKSIRRFGTKFLPYLILILVAFILELELLLIYKGLLLLVLILSIRGYTIMFFDDHTQRNLPIAIAQASIFCLYACYLYFFLKHVHIISFAFIALIICTYLSWSNYYLAQKSDPGVITSNRDQHLRTIIQLIEQNQFDYETFCTWCLIRRPLRSKHCRDCQRCVARFDHHCPWVDNCVGDKNLKFFTGFLFFTPICLVLFLHGAYLYLRNECLTSPTGSLNMNISQLPSCAPAVLWFTSIAALHVMWITGLCVSILFQISIGLTTNERINFWRYKYMQSPMSSPFSFGCIQNFVDLLNRRLLWYTPICVDWMRIYSMDDFKESVSRRRYNGLSSTTSSKLLNV